MSSCRPQASVRAGNPGAKGVVTLTAPVGLVDGGGEQGEGGPGGRGRGRPGGAVEPDDGVEVDDAAALVFGDLGVGDPDLGGEGLAGEPGLAGQCPAQGDREPAPQFGGAGVEQHRHGVVIAIWAQRLAEPVVIPGVLLATGQADAVRASLALPARSAGQHPAVYFPAGVDCPERRRGEGDEDARMFGDGGGDGPCRRSARRGWAGRCRRGRSRRRAGSGTGGGSCRRSARSRRVRGRWSSGGSVRRCRRRCSRRGRAAEPVASTLRCAGWRLRGQGWAKAVLLSPGVDERRQAPARPVKAGFTDQRCCAACGGLARCCLPLRRVMWWHVHRDPGPDDSPARHLHGHPSMGRGSYGLSITVPMIRD
jgi:hypothetical protein